MNTGRPPKPTAIKALQGTDRRDRSLHGEVKPAHVTMPTPPEWLSEYGQDEWYIQTGELEALKLLSQMDLSMLAIYCQQVGIYRQAHNEMVGETLVVETPNGAYQPNALLGIANKAADLALKIAGQFGFTPSARTRLGNPQPMQKDQFDELYG